MLPDATLQLRAVIKALVDVIGPAVIAADRTANEQLHLAVATLRMLESRVPFLHQRARAELRNAIALGAAVADSAPDAPLEIALREAREALSDVEADTQTLQARKSTLLSAASALANAPEQTSGRAISRAIILTSKGQFDLARAWCLPAGFELEPAAIPSLESLLALDRENP